MVFSLPLQTSFKTFQVTRLAKEEESYNDAIEHFQNVVDVILSSESEDTLINLSHIPKAVMDETLDIQAYALGLYPLSDLQKNKMPAIIGKNIQAMHLKIYESILPTVDQAWPAIQKESQPLSSLNGIVAHALINHIDSYDLLATVKQDLEQVGSGSRRAWWKPWRLPRDNSIDLLTEFVANVKTSLLLELHAQLADLLTRVQIEEDFIDCAL
ncbi:hypothetical protein BY458DRAFT_444983 [Sporodiniella umbellata]|nr:hypothetical protein BY458DRAFT_444983 [Sporodiniella umbellata]